MFWSRPAIRSMIKVTATGAVVTTVTTVSSCALALVVERAAHRTMFRFFPHWYADVRYAYGITELELESVRVRSIVGGPNTQRDDECEAIRTVPTSRSASADNSLSEIEQAKLVHRDGDPTRFDPLQSTWGDESDDDVILSADEEKSRNQTEWLRSKREEISQHVLSVALTG